MKPTSVVLHHPAPLPSPIRTHADRTADRIARFTARYPQYARLAPDVILQYAETYRDDTDHALEQDLRDNGVLPACSVDYSRFRALDRGEVPFSDYAVLEAS